jgi:transposase-like protein
MGKPQQPAIFKWRHFAPEVILCAVRWYLRYSLSYRDVQELLVERGLEIDHTTVWRWVQHYAPELEERTRPHLKSTNKSWRVDETYVRIKGRWFYLYPAIDSAGATIDFFLSAFRSAAAAKALLAKALADPSHPQPRVINTDKAKCYPPAIYGSKGRRSPTKALPSSASSISEQHSGARSPCHQETNSCQATFSSIRVCTKDNSRLRSDP